MFYKPDITVLSSTAVKRNEGNFAALEIVTPQSCLLKMENSMSKILEERGGAITVIAVAILTILTILGICVSGLSRMELLISKNEANSGNYFYISEGGVHREAQEIGNGSYRIKDTDNPSILATEKSSDLPMPSPHYVMGSSYDFAVQYVGKHLPAKGFSATSFNRYDYDIDVSKEGSGIKARYFIIGPKTN